MDFGKTIREAYPLLFDGLKMTVAVSVTAIIIGIVIGFVTCMLGRSQYRILRFVSSAYIWVVRGIPMMVQAFIVYFGIPQVIGMVIDGFRVSVVQAAIATLALNSGAYLSEIFRTGISAVDNGQIEAARSLGFSAGKTMLKIVLPQAVRIATPAMVNQFIITIKDSSILSAIGLAELFNKAKVYIGSTYQFFAGYTLVGLCYLLIISVLTIAARRIEEKLNYTQK